MKIALFGYNNLSFDVAARLDHKLHDILIIETDSALVDLAQQRGYKTVTIDFRSDKELKSVGIGQDIEVIFCFLTQDSDNVFLTLSARAIDKELNIISIVDSSQSAEKMIAAGANKTIDPYQICGRKIHEIIKHPDISNVIEHTVFGRHDLHVAEICISKGSHLENTLMSELISSEQYNLVIVGIVDKELGEDLHFSISEKDHKLDEGDIILVLGPSGEISKFKKDISYA